MSERTLDNRAGGQLQAGGAVSSVVNEASEPLACPTEYSAYKSVSGGEHDNVPPETSYFECPTANKGLITNELERIVQGIDCRPVYRFIKRLFDLTFSLCVLVIFFPILVIIAFAVWIDDPHGSPLFCQERVGKRGKPFKMVKFRSMYMDAEERLEELLEANEKDSPVFKIKDDPRITRVGKFIRKASLDELPQFWNVLVGDMSIVGPRPALPREAAQYSKRDRLRLAVKPGITCYWQTRRNRDSIAFSEWVDLDLLYIKQCSIWADIKLIIQTVGCVLTFQGE